MALRSTLDLTVCLDVVAIVGKMSTDALLDQDFGSESEDDNFNPAPADESDNEVPGDSDHEARPSTKSGTDRRKGRQSESDDVKDEYDEENKGSTSGLGDSKPFRGPALDEEDGGEDVDGAGADDEEDEEELEEDDDEEDVVSVGPISRPDAVHVQHPFC